MPEKSGEETNDGRWENGVGWAATRCKDEFATVKDPSGSTKAQGERSLGANTPRLQN